jgi:hypothetical protein
MDLFIVLSSVLRFQTCGGLRRCIYRYFNKMPRILVSLMSMIYKCWSFLCTTIVLVRPVINKREEIPRGKGNRSLFGGKRGGGVLSGEAIWIPVKLHA